MCRRKTFKRKKRHLRIFIKGREKRKIWTSKNRVKWAKIQNVMRIGIKDKGEKRDFYNQVCSKENKGLGSVFGRWCHGEWEKVRRFFSSFFFFFKYWKTVILNLSTCYRVHVLDSNISPIDTFTESSLLRHFRHL